MTDRLTDQINCLLTALSWVKDIFTKTICSLSQIAAENYISPIRLTYHVGQLKLYWPVICNLVCELAYQRSFVLYDVILF